MQVGGFVLAGGKSTRMGRDKALLELDGQTLIERALASLRPVCAEVAIAGGSQELRQSGRMVPDEMPGRGPLSGIVAALEDTGYAWNLFHAVDVPFVPVGIWRALLAVAEASAGVGIMARVAGRVHPLCAAYHRRAASTLREQLQVGLGKVTRAVELAGAVEYVDFEQQEWFRNVNTPEEFRAVCDTGDNETGVGDGESGRK